MHTSKEEYYFFLQSKTTKGRAGHEMERQMEMSVDDGEMRCVI